METRSDSPRAWLTASPIAHRGLHGNLGGHYRPENSLAAFEFAVEHCVSIELDVRLTADGHAVVFHDVDLTRMIGIKKAIADVNLRELRTLRLNGTNETVPTLADVLSLAAGRVPILIELKSTIPVGPLEAAVLTAIGEHSMLKVAIQSFGPESIMWFRRHAPWVARGQLAGRQVGSRSTDRWLLRHYAFNWRTRPHFIGHELADLPFWSASLCRHLGIPLLAWTARGINDIRAALMIADNCIFEVADNAELNEVLRLCRPI